MAGGIRKKVIQILPRYDTKEKEQISYCPHCLEHGVYELLGSRILKPNEPVPEDYDQWRSCVGCGRTLPIYEQKFESEIEDIVESVDNPHDVGLSIVDSDNKMKRSKKSDTQRLKERIERIKDEDIKRELRMGHTVEIREDSG